MSFLRFRPAVVLSLVYFFAGCSSGSSGAGVAYNFNGDWETSALTLKDEDGACEALLGGTLQTFPPFNYAIEQVGENITLQDDSGVLTGADQGQRFVVRDESEMPGEVFEPVMLPEPYTSADVDCRARTTIYYYGNSAESGDITLEINFVCTEKQTGRFVSSCTLRYTGTSQLISETQTSVSGQ